MRSSLFFVTLLVVLIATLVSTASAQFVQTCEAECKSLDKMDFSDEERADCWNSCYRAQCVKTDCIVSELTDPKESTTTDPADPQNPQVVAEKKLQQCLNQCGAWTCTRTCKPGYFGSVACKSGCQKDYKDEEEEEYVKPVTPTPKPVEPKPVDPKPAEPKPETGDSVSPAAVLEADQPAGAYRVKNCKKGLFGSCTTLVFVKHSAGKVWAFQFKCDSALGCLFGGKGKVDQSEVVAWRGSSDAKAEHKGDFSSVFANADEKSLLAAIDVFNGSWKKYSRKTDADAYAGQLVKFLTQE